MPRRILKHIWGDLMTERVTFILKYGWILFFCLEQKGHFTHPGQRGWCLSTTRALSVHVPGLQHPRSFLTTLVDSPGIWVQPPQKIQELPPLQGTCWSGLGVPQSALSTARRWPPSRVRQSPPTENILILLEANRKSFSKASPNSSHAHVL